MFTATKMLAVALVLGAMTIAMSDAANAARRHHHHYGMHGHGTSFGPNSRSGGCATGCTGF